MNPYNLALLLFSFCSFFVGLLVLLKRNDEVGKLFFFFNVTVTGWSFGMSWVLSNQYGYDVSLWAARAGHFCSNLLTATWLHFVLLYIGIAQKRKRIIKLTYIMSLIFILTVFTPWFISHTKPIVGFQYYTGPGPVYYVYAIEFTIVVLYGFFELIKAARSQIGERKKQIYIFTIIAAIGFISGSLTFLPVFDIPLPQYNVFVTPFYPFLLAYVVMKRGVLDSEEVMVIQKDKLALLGLMTSSLNHEIKNPLFLLRGYVQKAKGGQVESLDKMTEQIDRIGKLTERLSEFSRSGSTAGKTEQVDIAQAIENALFFANHELKYHNIEIIKQIDENLSKPLGDKGQFEQILLNLIMNAFHSMAGGGILTIVVRSTRYQIRDARYGVEIVIQDTGTGISKESLKNIFKPFYSTKGKQGTGLGLHIVKTLVEQNGGKISVESEVGRGTSFTLLFSGDHKI